MIAAESTMYQHNQDAGFNKFYSVAVFFLRKREPRLKQAVRLDDHRWAFPATQSRDEHWTGSGLQQILLNLDWIRTVNHFEI